MAVHSVVPASLERGQLNAVILLNKSTNIRHSTCGGVKVQTLIEQLYDHTCCGFVHISSVQYSHVYLLLTEHAHT